MSHAPRPWQARLPIRVPCPIEASTVEQLQRCYAVLPPCDPISRACFAELVKRGESTCWEPEAFETLGVGMVEGVAL